ncbi:hypothetical protein HPB48_008240 [Haemaphysalis longicornis]|uniref:Solute carrier organic anion transporter family member n=1 Tax=Haemaphysalis longicornis TaxID=44386 RepID=A0A9J6GZZ8_HAELO|nr:hypothetical protein HPB48_008240 [Haemaphysalis longicornis]
MATKTTKFRALPTSDTPNVDREGPPEETDPDFMCGVFDYRPQWMQRFAKTGYFLVCFIVYGIFQGALKAYLNGCITTLEKKFGLTGRTFSVILIADNLSSLPACLLIGHFARKVSRPKLIAFAVWMSVLGCLLAALPYFIYGPGFVGGFHEQLGRGNDDADPLYSGARKEYCTREDGDESESDLDESPPTSAILAVCMFFIANFCNGFGGAAFYISGTTYTDDNAKKMDSIVYFSFIFSLRFLGPMLGYVMASVCLGIYESPLENPAISRKHPSWIGAWWLGFVIWGVSLAFMSVPMAFFPKQIRRNSLPVDKKVLQGKEAPLSATPDTLREKISRDLAEFGQSFARLCKNPVLMWKIAIITFAFNGIGGYVTMFPKSDEDSGDDVWNLPRRPGYPFLKPKPRTIGLMEAASDLVDIIALIAGMTLSCSGWQLAGTTMRSDGSSGNSSAEDALTDGFCEFSCDNFYILVVLTSISKLVAQLPRVGGMMVTLRCVDAADKTLAMGLIGAAYNLFAAIPYPLIYSALFDATCLVWEERGGHRGNCSFYDADTLRLAFHGVTIAFLGLSMVSNLIMAHYSKRVTNMYGEADARAEESAAVASLWDDSCLRMVELDQDAMRKVTSDEERPRK